MALRTDYKDDILDLTQNTQRKYRMITNADGTVSFEDVTVYSQVGDNFGAFELNQIANVVNEGSGNIDYFPDEDMIKIKDSEGNWHDFAFGGLSWNGYLFNNGDEIAKVTGGWSLSVKGTLGSDCYIKNTGTALKFWSANSGASGKSVLATENAIDFSKFSKVRIKGYYTASVNAPTIKFGFGASRDTVDVALQTWTGIKSKTTFDTTIDISQYQNYPAKYFMISFEATNTAWADFESTEIEFME